ncbi:MAG: diguanylate cyclase [Gammaproteobacteria bacterium]|nr:diguanylate cyclase [Gammaproteobacteria bacterium]
MNNKQNTEFWEDDFFVEDHIAPKLLVVSDADQKFAPLIERLGKLDIDIQSVSNSKDAILQAQNNDYFLILMGAQEMRQGGVEMAFALRTDEATRHTPVVFISRTEKTVGDEEESYGYGIAGADYVITPVHPDVVQKEVAVFLEMYRQKKELEYSENLYKTMATRDPLTLLGNRDQFETDLKKALANAKRHGYMIAVLYIDLDKFKPVNDTYGHKIGDEVLIEVADRLKKGVREGDFVARLGGDEFSILLNMIRDTQSAGVVAQKIISSLNQTIKARDYDINIGASIGITYYPDHGEDYETLLNRADKAMYEAKRSGQNNYRYFEIE